MLFILHLKMINLSKLDNYVLFFSDEKTRQIFYTNLIYSTSFGRQKMCVTGPKTLIQISNKLGQFRYSKLPLSASIVIRRESDRWPDAKEKQRAV